MSGSSLDGLDIAYVAIQELAGSWKYEILKADCLPYHKDWKNKLSEAPALGAGEWLVLDTAFGRYIGEKVLEFIKAQSLDYQVNFICSHGHTSFHLPKQHTTAQLGDGASIAAVTGLPVISGLRAMDMALGGQGAPLVPAGEKYLFPEYAFLLNLGGIANISFNSKGNYQAFDICPANRVLNALASVEGKEYDENGELARAGKIHEALLQQLNIQPYYRLPFPKSLANEFGIRTIIPLIEAYRLETRDALRTYCEHIAIQVGNSVGLLGSGAGGDQSSSQMLITGGGAFNGFLTERIKGCLETEKLDIIIPDEGLVKFKEALIMAFLGVLRWRQMDTALASVTGASRDSSGGALWLGRDN